MYPYGLRVTGKLFFVLISLFWFSGDCLAQSAFDCAAKNCGIPTDKPYDRLVVGTIDAIATPEQSKAIFNHLRKQGWWQSLPADAEAFAQKVQPVSFLLPSGRSMTLLMSMEEMRGAPLHVGELGRFAPHSNFDWSKPEAGNPYWATYGCIVELCAKGDEACKKGYHPAIYHLPDGHELDISGEHIKPGGITIDNQSIRPVHQPALQQHY